VGFSGCLVLVLVRLLTIRLGMFLWVRLVLESLGDAISHQGMEKALDELPTGLGEA
jgi:hypothetical protein